MKNPLNHARAVRSIALFFLVLVLVGVVAAFVHSFQVATAPSPASRPAAESAQHPRETVPATRAQK